MNKILLALCIVGTGAGSFHAARQATTQVHNEADTARAAWLAETQLALAAETEQAELAKRVREQESVLNQPQAVGESALWSTLQTNRNDHLAPELREHLFQELGLSWASSGQYILVTKQTLRDVQLESIRNGELTQTASTVFAITPSECDQVAAAIERVKTEFRDWALSHVQRHEPHDGVLADYTYPEDPALMESIIKDFTLAVFNTLGPQRTQLILPSARNWMVNELKLGGHPAKLVVERYRVGNEQRLKFDFTAPSGYSGGDDLSNNSQPGPVRFPSAFLPVFPNGWAEVAKREGFELPAAESQEK